MCLGTVREIRLSLFQRTRRNHFGVDEFGFDNVSVAQPFSRKGFG